MQGTHFSGGWIASWQAWISTLRILYLDDIIISSRSLEEHLQHLRVLFQRFQAAGLVINQEKCVFGVKEVEFLGHLGRQGRRAVFSIFHDLAHAGMWVTGRLLAARVVWRGMNAFVAAGSGTASSAAGAK
jgi:hypothetical protein